MDKEYYKSLSTRAADGDAKSFSKLYEMLYREMYYTAFYSLKTEEDAIDAVIGAARDGFNSIGRLRTEEAFELFMMRTLCSRIKTCFKDYGSDRTLPDDCSNVKREFFKLDHLDRLCAVLYVAAHLDAYVISTYVGLTKGGVKKRLSNALKILEE